jgi:hypothetical protein
LVNNFEGRNGVMITEDLDILPTVKGRAESLGIRTIVVA